MPQGSCSNKKTHDSKDKNLCLKNSSGEKIFSRMGIPVAMIVGTWGGEIGLILAYLIVFPKAILHV